MNKNANSQELQFKLPTWVVVSLLGGFVIAVGTLVSVSIFKENVFYQGYAQARAEIAGAVGSQEHADVALTLFDRTAKCQRRGKQRVSPSSSAFAWATTPNGKIETVGRQVARDCFLAQVNALEMAQDSDLIEKMRAAAR